MQFRTTIQQSGKTAANGRSRNAEDLVLTNR